MVFKWRNSWILSCSFLLLLFDPRACGHSSLRKEQEAMNSCILKDDDQFKVYFKSFNFTINKEKSKGIGGLAILLDSGSFIKSNNLMLIVFTLSKHFDGGVKFHNLKCLNSTNARNIMELFDSSCHLKDTAGHKVGKIFYLKTFASNTTDIYWTPNPAGQEYYENPQFFMIALNSKENMTWTGIKSPVLKMNHSGIWIGTESFSLQFDISCPVSQQNTMLDLDNTLDVPQESLLYRIPRTKTRSKRSNSSFFSRGLRLKSALEIYPQCHKIYGCIGNTEDCIATRNCKSLITYESIRNLKLISFQILAQFPDSKNRMRKVRSTEKGYVAIGLSYDKKMGNDVVVECTFLPDGEFGVYFSWNFEGYQNKRVQHLNCSSSTRVLTNCSAAIVDGIMTCNFSLDEHFIKHDNRFDLVYEEYFIFTAIGSQLNESQISKHDEVFLTSKKISLNYIQKPPSFEYETKLHAIFMIYVWLVFVPSGIFLARYFKESFFKNQGQIPRLFLGRRVYFSLHVSIVFLGFVLLITSIGYILYVTYTKRHRWSEDANVEIHMKIGGAACLLYVIQMASGWVRPIDQGNRRIFSVGHWLIGTASQILSFVNLLMSTRLGNAKMPCIISLIVIIWLIYTILMHILMALHFRSVDGKLGRRTKRGLSPFPMQNVTRQSAPGLKMRIVIFCFYFIGCMSLAITSNILILNSKKDCNCENCYV